MQNSSNIQSDVEITGSITFKGELNFDGQLKKGNITGSVLTIGAAARIEGNIEADRLLVFGSVTGDVKVAEKCDLKGSAKLVGSLATNRLVMEEGATLIGQAEITPDLKSHPPVSRPTGSAGAPSTASAGAPSNGDLHSRPIRR